MNNFDDQGTGHSLRKLDRRLRLVVGVNMNVRTTFAGARTLTLTQRRQNNVAVQYA